VDVGRAQYKIHATLVPNAPRTPTPVRQEAPYVGTVHVMVESARGQTFERDYVARGPIDLEGGLAVAPAGFDLPGASSPSREHDLLHHEFLGEGELSSVDLDVSVSMFDDPRHPL
jgi:hypothetical protein